MKPVENVIKHLETMVEMRNEIEWHFRIKSKLYDATKEYIVKNKDNAFCSHPQNYIVTCHRGTGLGVRIIDCGIWGQECKENKLLQECKENKLLPREVFWIRLEIEFFNEEENHEIIKKKEINFPLDLEENFSDEKFQLWVKEKEKQKKDKDSEIELKLLKNLMQKYQGEF